MLLAWMPTKVGVKVFLTMMQSSSQKTREPTVSSKKKNIIPPQSFNLLPVGVETHAHLDFPDFAEDLNLVLDRAGQAGIAWIGNIFLSVEAYRDHASRLIDSASASAIRPQLFFTLGIHPHEADTVASGVLADMEACFRNDNRLRALGEIGLDFYWDRSPRKTQVRAFQDQLALAKALDLPVVIHSRDAQEQTLNILRDMGFARRPLLWHCFGAGPELARLILAQGWHLSIPGPVTFPKSADLRRAVSEIPLSATVLETDCPFLTPQPLRGKRNEPAYLAYTAVETARLRGQSADTVWTECAATARRFFNLPEVREPVQ